MVGFPVLAPGRLGFVPAALERAYDALRRASESGEIPASVLCVGRTEGMVEPRGFGVDAGALFSVASITKPVVAAAAMKLVERGQLALNDRVTNVLPEFGACGKQDVRIRHLLTHTSGLPDMLPENDALRARHAPVWAFIEQTCQLEPLFPAGTRVRYQSMGFAVLAGILERILQMPLSQFLRREFLEALGMNDTCLGCPPELHHRVAPIRLEPAQEATDWNWNTPYWLSLGAPWGGLVSTAADLARFARMMLAEGTVGRDRVLGAMTVRAMVTNQLTAMPGLAAEDRRCRPWGLGWRLQGAGHAPGHGDLLGPRTYGHHGATGTLLWIDPEADAFCVLLTTRPLGEEGRHVVRISNLVSAALG